MDEKELKLQNEAESQEEELNLDDLDQVSGGALGNARKGNTGDITADIARRG